jgi:hypothetical protein
MVKTFDSEIQKTCACVARMEKNQDVRQAVGRHGGVG